MAIIPIDKKVRESIDKAFSSILLDQKQYMGIKPPSPERKVLLAEELSDYEKYRGRGAFYQYLSTGKGHGPFTELLDGSIKYDLIGGIGVNLLGHSHPVLIKAALDAAACDIIMCGNLQPYLQAANLAREIVKSVEGSKLKHFRPAGSGSFANDTALKMVWQKSAPHRYGIFAFEGAFAGRSVATQEITHSKAYREGMPELMKVKHLPFPGKETKAKDTLALIDAELKVDPNYCCMIVELIQGEGGIRYAESIYWKELFKGLKERQLYIWSDEVQTFGRTGELFAFQKYHLEEYVDIVTVGKALQVCGILYSEELNPKPGLVSGTFNGSLSAINAATATLRYLLNGNFLGRTGRVNELHESFLKHLRILEEKYPSIISNISGVGLMMAFQYKNGDPQDTNDFIQKLFQKGVIGFTAGSSPKKVRFLPPLCLLDDHIDEIFNIIEGILD